MHGAWGRKSLRAVRLRCRNNEQLNAGAERVCCCSWISTCSSRRIGCSSSGSQAAALGKRTRYDLQVGSIQEDKAALRASQFTQLFAPY